MSHGSQASEHETLTFAFNGRRFARKAEEYCRQHGLQFQWRNNHTFPARFSMTNFDVTGTAEQLREFVEWGDAHYPRPGFAQNFEGDSFMGPEESQLG